VKVNLNVPLPVNLVYRKNMYVTGVVVLVVVGLIEWIGQTIEQSNVTLIIVQKRKLSDVLSSYEKISRIKVIWVSMERRQSIVPCFP
jgi:hypothetical protein